MRYLIPVENTERLAKKVARIQKKCEKYGNEFVFDIVDDNIIKEVEEDGRKFFVKFYEVEVEGVAKVDGWEFVGTINHFDSENVIFTVSDKFSVPERYRTCKSNCEHCNRIRSRKDTYIVYNTDTDEYKQVGKSCLMEYTNGLDAKLVSNFEQYFHEVEELSFGSYGGYTEPMYNVHKVLLNAVRFVNKYGYVKELSLEDARNGVKTTRDLVRDIICSKKGDESVFSDEEHQFVNNLIEYYKNQDGNNNYVSNLNTIIRNEFTTFKFFNTLISSIPSYQKYLVKEEEKRIRFENRFKEESKSEYVGEVGKRVQIEIAHHSVVYSFETVYGWTYINKFVDADGNIIIWKTSRSDFEDCTKLVGTVKEQKEYRNIKQTVLTRCKVVA